VPSTALVDCLGLVHAISALLLHLAALLGCTIRLIAMVTLSILINVFFAKRHDILLHPAFLLIASAAPS